MVSNDDTANNKPDEEIKQSWFMDRLSIAWLWLGHTFGVRPATVIGIVLGALIFASGITYNLVKTDNNTKQLEQIQHSFCNGGAQYTPIVEARCRDLLDQLLRNPAPEQIDRLKELVRDS